MPAAHQVVDIGAREYRPIVACRHLNPGFQENQLHFYVCGLTGMLADITEGLLSHTEDGQLEVRRESLLLTGCREAAVDRWHLLFEIVAECLQGCWQAKVLQDRRPQGHY